MARFLTGSSVLLALCVLYIMGHEPFIRCIAGNDSFPLCGLPLHLVAFFAAFKNLFYLFLFFCSFYSDTFNSLIFLV